MYCLKLSVLLQTGTPASSSNKTEWHELLHHVESVVKHKSINHNQLLLFHFGRVKKCESAIIRIHAIALLSKHWYLDERYNAFLFVFLLSCYSISINMLLRNDFSLFMYKNVSNPCFYQEQFRLRSYFKFRLSFL